ncbi:hypothetical protein COLO4_04045 [Corchorus olitorius]|uniref:Ankyrin repeat-containing protein n=1 Tax=Corchorus olitorius TaxID=93759 RepID=A0A1R3KVL7_9ROSI|nr:hypothetical protein COLO4_04045 [Corchorus olitorius]
MALPLYYDYLSGVRDAIEKDNSDEFIRHVKDVVEWIKFHNNSIQLIIELICEFEAVKCATALLGGEVDIGQGINISVPFKNDYLRHNRTVLHEAIESPELVELFLRHGAPTHTKYSFFDQEENNWKTMIPLTYALHCLRHRNDLFSGWSPQQSIFTMMIVLCLPKLRKPLKAIALLYRGTKEVEKEIYRYVKESKLFEIAVLLMAAGEEIASPTLFQGLCDDFGLPIGSMTLRQFVLKEIDWTKLLRTSYVDESDERAREYDDDLVKLNSMLLLLDVFEKVGDKIDSFHQTTEKVTDSQVALEMGCLLDSAGLTYEDFPLNGVERF